MAVLKNAVKAVIDERKIRDYALSMASADGRHKARVILAATGLTREDYREGVEKMSHASSHSIPTRRSERGRPPQCFELLQVVYARTARPELGVREGDRGTVVEIFDRPQRAYYVEFVADDGTTRAEGAFVAGDLATSLPAPG